MISEAGVKIQKFKLQKKISKDILNNVKPNSKAQATTTFSISALISEKWAFKAKKCWYFGNKGPNKKSVLCKKVLKSVFWYFQMVKKKIIFFQNFDFFWNTLWKKNFQRLKISIFVYFLGYQFIWPQKCPLEAFNRGGQNLPPPRPKYVKLDPVQCRVKRIHCSSYIFENANCIQFTHFQSQKWLCYLKFDSLEALF